MGEKAKEIRNFDLKEMAHLSPPNATSRMIATRAIKTKLTYLEIVLLLSSSSLSLL